MANQFDNFIYRKTPYDLKQLSQVLDASYSDAVNSDEFLTKKSFSPSSLGYLSGTCPRRWVMAFDGARFVNTYDSASVDNMSTGTSSHERIQDNFRNSDLEIEVEYDLWVNDPPIHGYVDLIVRDYNGYDIVIEIKTTRAEAFYSRRAKSEGPEYHLLQLLIYMYFLNIDHGILLYENKNDHKKLLIPVEMTPENIERIQGVVKWMREVYKAHKDGELPERPFRKNSKACASCPLFDHCVEQPKGTIKIEPLNYSVKNDTA